MSPAVNVQKTAHTVSCGPFGEESAALCHHFPSLLRSPTPAVDISLQCPGAAADCQQTVSLTVSLAILVLPKRKQTQCTELGEGLVALHLLA